MQRDIGSLARYTVEMGGEIELLELALQTPPWEPMHRLTIDEIRRFRLTTVERPFEQDIPLAGIPLAQPASLSAGSPASGRN